MQIVLETERLTIRQFLGSDLAALVELDSDPAVMQFINGGRPTARSVIEGRLLPMYLAPDRPAEEPELGYRLRRSAWGRGYASEGRQALIDKGFAEWGRSSWWLRRWRSTWPRAGSWKSWE